MNKNLISLSILSLLLLSGCNGSSNSSSPIPEKQTRSELDFNKAKFSPKNGQWLSYEEKTEHLGEESSEIFYIQYIPKSSVELIELLNTLPQDEAVQLETVINNHVNNGVENFYVRIIKNSMGVEDTDFLYDKDGQLYRINEEVSLSLINLFNKHPSLIGIFDGLEFPKSAQTYKDKEIKLSSLKHEIIGLKISDDDAYRLIKHYDINDTQMVISRCSLNWKREPKRLENGNFLEMINNQQIEIGLIEYNSTLTLECLNDAQPSSTTLIDDKITTIYHPTFGYLRHIEIIGLDQTTLTLQDLKWTTQ
ncbi:hypothetical protein MPV89_003176 [Vibrio vulnificus]|uniref:hypothetical protein n=1 Tax=Vibrio vulnificus TaxID=672 RepID=UPI000B4DED2D|nr:hypothetical protein [Vibrio vulnificus]ASC56322.1 hypothetical protein FORC37_0628 [Vibrio vulnificus]EHH2448646.1 hypothetical protein [Vibrio vulnificus]EIZ4668991.1 hypothetical protein [Vibrio vulnificus]HDY7867197.1 hypothetical protein [Vibrio vulnificus]